MKKTCSIILTCLFLLSLAGQNTITTERPCTDVMAQNAKGRWIKGTDLGSHNSKENVLLDQIHDWILKLYPQPTGVDVVWSRSTGGVSYFSAKRKFYNPNDKKLTFDKSSFPHFNQSSYAVRFFRYRCGYGKTHTLQKGIPGVTNTSIGITSNVKLGDMVTDDGSKKRIGIENTGNDVRPDPGVGSITYP